MMQCGGSRHWIRRLRERLIYCVGAWLFAATLVAGAESQIIPSSDLLSWRTIGPYRGGRVCAVAGHKDRPHTFFFGATGGGVWKTDDAGQTWMNVSDGFFATGSVGAIAVAPSDPATIYVGMGECSIRGDVSHGDGVYKSTDRGQTWTPVGLNDSRHISRIWVHPQNADLVYVAALGHLAGPNEQRGIFRSRNGGRDWERILFVDADSGAIELQVDSANPSLMYAAFWQVRRAPWGLRHGGIGSQIHRSTDGGDSWTLLSGKGGLPGGVCERIALATGAKPDRIWALISSEHEKGVFLSEDRGGTWSQVNQHPDLFVRPFYFNHMKADPVDEDTIYFLNFRIWKSTDAGRSFTKLKAFHADHHDMWISPSDNRRMIDGSDGGALRIGKWGRVLVQWFQSTDGTDVWRCHR